MEDACGSASLAPLLEHDRKHSESNGEVNTETESDNDEKEDPNGCYTEEMVNEEDVSPIEQVALQSPQLMIHLSLCSLLGCGCWDCFHILGFGWAGIFRRTLHEEEERQRGVTRIQFFLIALTCSFAYYRLPGYLFPLLTSFSWLCWMFPLSIIAQQVGSGLHGLGLGAVGLDWSTICSYLGSPLATPWFAVASVAAYEKHGQLHLSTFFVFTYGIAFATLTATVMHEVIFHGKDLWNLSIHTLKDREMDVHARLMRKYKAVPEWWFLIILALTSTVTITVCEWFKDQLQLRWWGVLL
ncbi:hypothetical protein SUGI_0468610 [Cryptomeria japonica]|nr:hypothetical protein SUGI_0468610 [Cryptomeria japonica]